MKKITLLLYLFIIASNTCFVIAQPARQVKRATFTNPLPVAFGDPYVLHVKRDKYYMYGTGGGAKQGFSAYSSSDLVNWKPEGQVYFGNNKNGWGYVDSMWNGAYWAPEVIEVKGKYYLFYSAQWNNNPTNELENFRIGVAVADKPTGPFIDIKNQPLFDPGYPIIDANVLFNPNGKIYLYYSRCCYKHPVKSEVADWAKAKGWFNEIEESWVYGIELKPDFSGVIGKPVLLLRPPVSMKDKQAEWESRSVTLKEVNRRWTEGSVTFKKGNTYYMMYSANYFGGKNYAVGYATSTHPLGPYKKAANNPVLEKNIHKGGIVTGTGHNSITYSPDGKEMFSVYHGRTTGTGDERVVFIDRMRILKDGTLIVDGPTTSPQPIPSAATKQTSNNIETIKSRSALWNTSYNTRDSTTFYTLFDSLAIVTSAGGRWIGAEECKRLCRSLYARRPDITWVKNPDKIEVNNQWNVAYETGTWSEEWTEAGDNQKSKILGKYWIMWRYKKDDWVIISAIFTPLSCSGSYCKK